MAGRGYEVTVTSERGERWTYHVAGSAPRIALARASYAHVMGSRGTVSLSWYPLSKAQAHALGRSQVPQLVDRK